MEVSDKEIENFVIAHANNIYLRYYWKCPICFKVGSTILPKYKIPKAFSKHKVKAHYRVRVKPECIRHNYPDINYLNSKELYILWLSLLCGKRYSKTDNEKDVYDRCLSYVRDVIDMNRIDEGSRKV
jgi:hypothetical protein